MIGGTVVCWSLAEVGDRSCARILRPHREPASRLAWVGRHRRRCRSSGIIAYLLLGEIRISTDAPRARPRDRRAGCPRPQRTISRGSGSPTASTPRRSRSPAAINGLGPTGGNSARLAADSNVAIDEMVADIDAAKRDRSPLRLHLAGRHQRLQDQGCAASAPPRAGSTVRAAGRRARLAPVHPFAATGASCATSGCRRPGRASGRQSAVDLDPRPGRPSQPSQAAGRRQSHRLVREPERRRPRIPHQAALRALGRHHDAAGKARSRAIANICSCPTGWREGGDDISDLLSRAAGRAGKPAQIVAQVIGTGPTVQFDAMPACFAELIHSARARAGRHDALFRARRAGAVRADLGRPARRRDDPRLAQAQRQPDRRRDQPQLLPGPDRRRREAVRISLRPAPREDDGRRPRRSA